MITLHDDDGRRMFAFSGKTDPLEVVVAVAWAWADGQSLCDWACPTRDGQYCLDCHVSAYGAVQEAKRRGFGVNVNATETGVVSAEM